MCQHGKTLLVEHLLANRHLDVFVSLEQIEVRDRFVEQLALAQSREKLIDRLDAHRAIGQAGHDGKQQHQLPPPGVVHHRFTGSRN